MKTRKKLIGFIAALLFSFGYIAIIMLWQGVNPFTRVSTLVFTITNLISVLLIAGLFQKILSNNLKKSAARLKKELFPSFLLFVALTVTIALVIFALGNYALFLINDWGTDNYWSLLLNEFGGAAISLLIGISASGIIFFYATWQQAVNREQRLHEENLKYRYRTLKTQVNPHFLFNSLNTLSEIVHTDADRSDRYIQKLASIYRYILDNEETDLIPLEKELTFVHSYFDLQKERNGNKIRLDIDLSDSQRREIVPISLQILIENALKHNSASEDRPLCIRIFEEIKDGYIVVTNNIQKKTILQYDSHGTGLSNLQQRTQLITGRKIVLIEDEQQFTVKIPVIIPQTQKR